MVMNAGGTEVSVEKVLDKEATFDDFKAALPDDQPRFGVWLLSYEKDGRKQSQICFVIYSPDACTNAGAKFAYANAKEAVKTKCSPVNKEF